METACNSRTSSNGQNAAASRKTIMPKLCLVVGDAPCKDADLTAALDLVDEFDVCCVNKAGLWYPGDFEHWFSWHANMLVDDWAQERRGPRLHSTYDYPGVEVWSVDNRYCGSGLLAVQVMLDCLEYDKALLVGMPMTFEYERFLSNWDSGDMGWRIRSMSGNTKIMFGYPSLEWING